MKINMSVIQNLHVYLSLPRYDHSHFLKLRGYITCLYDLKLIDLDDKSALDNLIIEYENHKSGYINADKVDKYIKSLKDKYIY